MKTGIERMVEWWKKSGKNLDPNMLCSPASEICAEMLRLAAEEKSKPAPRLNCVHRENIALALQVKACQRKFGIDSSPCPDDADEYCTVPAPVEEKPVAPAVLVEAKENIERAMRGITERQTQEDSYWRGYYNCLEETWDSLNVQISRYRPATQGDIVGKIKAEIKKSKLPGLNKIIVYNILSKYEEAK